MRRLKQVIHERRTTPSQCFNSDLYIVEFPKSGITWFSTILANLYFIRDPRGKQPTHFNLEQIVGDVHQTRDIQIPQVYPYHRTIKSHATYNRNYRNVIYLLRNPFSVMESYYHFAIANQIYSGNFEDFVRNRHLGIMAWRDHVYSWIEGNRQPHFQIIKYEQLKSEPLESLKALFDSVGFRFTQNEIEKAVNLSDFKAMRADNELYNQLNPRRRYYFVRSGQVASEMKEASRSFIIDHTKDFLSEFYPDFV